eukprot:TRINITY_DN3691_c1_g1_i6.p1 TRINITY_DN3691_c1_g1~~TRINITY_DN3691_c1_g1_i6.p1  ORF type:complete len:5023 (+),score=2068.97 TRINITY_DN3691_c1_g1_i6:290-15358(+)
MPVPLAPPQVAGRPYRACEVLGALLRGAGVTTCFAAPAAENLKLLEGFESAGLRVKGLRSEAAAGGAAAASWAAGGRCVAVLSQSASLCRAALPSGCLVVFVEQPGAFWNQFPTTAKPLIRAPADLTAQVVQEAVQSVGAGYADGTAVLRIAFETVNVLVPLPKAAAGVPASNARAAPAATDSAALAPLIAGVQEAGCVVIANTPEVTTASRPQPGLAGLVAAAVGHADAARGAHGEARGDGTGSVPLLLTTVEAAAGQGCALAHLPQDVPVVVLALAGQGQRQAVQEAKLAAAAAAVGGVHTVVDAGAGCTEVLAAVADAVKAFRRGAGAPRIALITHQGAECVLGSAAVAAGNTLEFVAHLNALATAIEGDRSGKSAAPGAVFATPTVGRGFATAAAEKAGVAVVYDMDGPAAVLAAAAAASATTGRLALAVMHHDEYASGAAVPAPQPNAKVLPVLVTPKPGVFAQVVNEAANPLHPWYVVAEEEEGSIPGAVRAALEVLAHPGVAAPPLLVVAEKAEMYDIDGVPNNLPPAKHAAPLPAPATADQVLLVRAAAKAVLAARVEGVRLHIGGAGVLKVPSAEWAVLADAMNAVVTTEAATRGAFPHDHVRYVGEVDPAAAAALREVDEAAGMVVLFTGASAAHKGRSNVMVVGDDAAADVCCAPAEFVTQCIEVLLADPSPTGSPKPPAQPKGRGREAAREKEARFANAVKQAQGALAEARTRQRGGGATPSAVIDAMKALPTGDAASTVVCLGAGIASDVGAVFLPVTTTTAVLVPPTPAGSGAASAVGRMAGALLNASKTSQRKAAKGLTVVVVDAAALPSTLATLCASEHTAGCVVVALRCPGNGNAPAAVPFHVSGRAVPGYVADADAHRAVHVGAMEEAFLRGRDASYSAARHWDCQDTDGADLSRFTAALEAATKQVVSSGGLAVLEIDVLPEIAPAQRAAYCSPVGFGSAVARGELPEVQVPDLSPARAPTPPPQAPDADADVAKQPPTIAPRDGKSSLARLSRLVGGSGFDKTTGAEFYTPVVRDRPIDFARQLFDKCTAADAYDTWEPLAHAAATVPDKTAYVEDAAGGATRRATYREMHARVVRVARYLSEDAGVAPGERVGLITPNIYQCMEAHYAIMGARGVVLNLNQRLSAEELAFVLDDAGPVWVVAARQFEILILDAITKSAGSVRGVLWIGGGAGDDPPRSNLPATPASEKCSAHAEFEAVAEGGGADGAPPDPFTPAPPRPDDGCEMYYTSGTTGRPKGVVLSYRNVVLHAIGCMLEHRHHAGDVWGHIAPIFHLVDAYGMFSITWICGSHVFVPSFSAAAVLTAIEKHRVTVTNMASTMVRLLLAHPGVDQRDMASLEIVSCGGAPLNREATLRALAVFGCEFFQSYGMTECCGKISMSLLNKPEAVALPASEQVDVVCTSGKCFGLPGFELRLMADSGEVIPETAIGPVGEVQIRGPTVFKEYYNRPDATAEAFEDGWFCTGDVARHHGHGYIVICDRKKDMILTGGENVYSAELERVLEAHPDVKHVGVFGIPNALLGEVAKAVVELHPGAAATPPQLRKHCEQLLADYKVPRVVEVVAAMPLTGSGKVAKSELKKREAEKQNAKQATAAPPAPAPAAAAGYLGEDTYHLTWAPARLDSYKKMVAGGWLVLADAAGVGGELVTKMRSDGAADVTAVGRDALADPCAADAYAQLWAATKPKGVVYMLTLDGTAAGAETSLSLDTVASTHNVLKELVAFFQGVIAAGAKDLDVFVVTRGAEVNGLAFEPAAAPSQQAVWGMVRVMHAEQSGFRCRLVDVCPGDTDLNAVATCVYGELQQPDPGLRGYESAWRARQRYTPSLARLPIAAPARPQLKPDACYILTGGLGGLGMSLTQVMLEDWGAKCLVLVSRRPPQGETLARLEALRAAHPAATIAVENADIGSLEGTEALFAKVGKGYPPVKGIFHLAGLVDDGTIDKQTWEKFEKTLAPKVAGSVHLHLAAEALPHALDYFVLFSSIYGVLGYRELTHYAAANAFQDGLALARRRLGKPALAVSWGTWAGAGMAHRFGSGFEAYWKGLGMEFVPLQGGMDTLGALCEEAGAPGRTVYHAGVFPASWERYAKSRRQMGPHPVCNALVEAAAKPLAAPAAAAAPPALAENAPPLLKQLYATPAEKRGAAAEAFLVEMLKEMLEIDECDAEAAVVDLGVTSVHVIDLTLKLSEAAGLDDLSPTFVYEFVTLKGVAKALVEEMSDLLAPAAAAAAAPAGPQVDPNAPPLVQQLQRAAAKDRLNILYEALVEATREVLDDEALEVDLTAPVVELGLTSMHVVNMTQAVTDMSGLDDLSPTFIYECVTLKGVADLLLSELPLADVAVAAAPAPDAAPEAAADGRMGGVGPWAVVGMACRLPGEANTPEQYFWNLKSEVDGIVPTPGDRPSNGRHSGYLTGDTIKKFDAAAFGISPTEAECMDPQQRLLLQCAKEAFEDAGIVVEELEDRRVGVFVGVSNVEYGTLSMQAVKNSKADPVPYCGTSWHLSIAANRISYIFDLSGPSMSMDTACSSSLSAMDAAVNAMNAGHCTMALVCGVNVQLVETWSDCFQAAGMLSPSYRCQFGDDKADGYVRGEGCGAVLIRPVKDAVARGDNVYAEVVGSSLNQDARSNGLTAPNSAAQEALLRAAYADLNPRDIVYVEAHGTGTHLGDPIELTALGRVLGAPKDEPPRDRPLLVGSVKSCIGHLECAAGIASIIKSALVLQSGAIPPSLHFKTPNTLIRYEQLGLEVTGQSGGVRDLPQPASGEPPMIGVSGFGFGGTNGHCVLRQHRPAVTAEPTKDEPRICVVPISCHSQEALRRTASVWADAAEDAAASGAHTLADVAHTATRFRHHGSARPHRAAVAASSLKELAERLRKVAESMPDPCAPTGQAVTGTPKVAFVFTGQGSQSVGMGQGLFNTSTPFREAMQECDRILGEKDLLGGKALVATLYGPAEACQTALASSGFLQAALLSVEYSLSRHVEQELGVTPQVLIGHSLGEITAAAVAGIYTLEEALTLAAHRGAAMAAIPAGQGAMAACRMGEEELKAFLASVAPKISVAAVNGPESCVISGPILDLKVAMSALKDKGRKVRQLVVTHGFHSAQIEPALERIRTVAETLQAKPARAGVEVVSNVTGEVMTELPDAQYWVDHARGSVLFMHGVHAALKSGVNVFYELGPQPNLTVQINMILSDHKKSVATVSTLQANKNDAELLAASAGALHNAGVPVRFGALVPEGRRVRLPPTALVGKEHWLDGIEVTKRQREAQLRDYEPKGVTFTTEWVEKPVGPATKVLGSALLVGDEPAWFDEMAAELEGASCYAARVCGPMTDLTVAKVSEALGQRRKWDALVFHASTPDYIHAAFGLVKVLQAAQKTKRAERVLVVTHGVFEKTKGTGLKIASACQASLWGLVRSARLEMRTPALQCVDCDPPSQQTDLGAALVEVPAAHHIVAELKSEAFGDDDVRLPSATAPRMVSRAKELPAVPKGKRYTAPTGAILITGGTGALGLQLGDWLVARGARLVVLLSRTAKIPAENEPLYTRLQATAARHGAEVRLQKCDVSNPRHSEALVKEYVHELSSGGLVHCAGRLDDGLLPTQTNERFENVMVPKVGGLLHLLRHMMGRGVRPPLMLLFSSVTALMGNVGQTSYGAANAFLDSVAAQLQAAGIKCTSVQWGPWGGYGMAKFMEAHDAAANPWKLLTPSVGWGALDTVLAADAAHDVVSVTDFNWSAMREKVEDSAWQKNLFSSVLKPLPQVDEDDGGDEMTDEDDETFGSDDGAAAAAPAPAPAATLEAVTDTVKAIMARYNKTGDETSAIALFLDSVDMTAVAGEIGKKCGIKANAMMVMEAGGVEDLAKAVHAEVLKQGGSVGAAAPAARGRRVTGSMRARAAGRPSRSGARGGTREMKVTAPAEPYYVLQKVQKVLTKYLKSGAAVTEETELGEMGLDSVDMTAVAQEVGREYSIRVSPMMVMEAVKVQDLVDEIIKLGAVVTTTQQVPSDDAPAARRRVARKASAPPAAEVAVFTPDEVAAGVKQVLAKFVKEGTEIADGTELVPLGLTSVDMTAMAVQLAKAFKVKLSPMVVMEAEHVADLVGTVQRMVKVATEAQVAKQKRVVRKSSVYSAPGSSPMSADAAGGEDELARLKRENADLAAEQEIRRREDRIAEYGGTLRGAASTFLPVLVFVIGIAAAIAGASYASSLNAAFTEWVEDACEHRSFAHLVSTAIFARMSLRLAAFFTLFNLAMVVYAILVKWVVIGRFRTGEYMKASAYGIRRACVVFTAERVLSVMLYPLRETEAIPLFFRLMGAEIGKNVILSIDIPRGSGLDFDLIHIGDDVINASDYGCETTVSPDGVAYVSQHTYIGAGSFIGRTGYVAPGSQLGRQVTVCVRSSAQGVVQSGSTCLDDKVLPPGTEPPTKTGHNTQLRTKAGVTWGLIALRTIGSAWFMACTAVSAALGLAWLWSALGAVEGGVCSTFGLRPTVVAAVQGDSAESFVLFGFILNTQAVLAILLCGVLSGVSFALLTLLTKWVLLGKMRPGSRRVTSSLVVRFRLVQNMVKVAEKTAVLAYFKYSPVMWLWYVALGMRLSFKALFSPFLGDLCWDLCSSGADSYWGYGVWIPGTICDATEGLVTFAHTSVGEKAFAGPECFLGAGSSIEDHAAVGANACIAPGTQVRPKTARVGSTSLALSYKQTLMAQGNTRFNIMNFFLWCVRTPVELVLGSAHNLPPFAMFAVFSPYMHSDLAFGLTIACVVISIDCILPLTYGFLWSMPMKWAMIGNPQHGDRYEWRGWHHARWIMALCTSFSAANMLKKVYKDTFVVKWYHVARGGTVARNTVMFAPPVTCESNLLTLEQGAFIGDKHVFYAHNFFNGYLIYEKSSVGRGAVAPFPCVIVPGSRVSEGVTVGPHSFVMPNYEEEKCGALVGNPAKSAAKLPVGFTIARPNTGVIPLEYGEDGYDRDQLRWPEDRLHSIKITHERRMMSKRRTSGFRPRCVGDDAAAEDDELATELQPLRAASASQGRV